MTGETIRELLDPLIGKPGSVYLLVARIGQFAFGASDNKLTGVEVRPDGMVRLERETGWAVLDPSEVMAVAWTGESGHTTGQFL